MADSTKQYAYYLEGNKIAIVQKNVSFNNNVSSKEYGPGVVKSAWESPQESVTDGIKIVYTISEGDDISDESYEFNLPVYLQKALIYYVKARLAEDEGEIKLKEYAMREFKKMIEKWENSRISGLRIVSPSSHAIR